MTLGITRSNLLIFRSGKGELMENFNNFGKVTEEGVRNRSILPRFEVGNAGSLTVLICSLISLILTQNRQTLENSECRHCSSERGKDLIYVRISYCVLMYVYVVDITKSILRLNLLLFVFAFTLSTCIPQKITQGTLRFHEYMPVCG